MTENERQLAKEARKKWAREYRKKNPEKFREANDRYWLKRALREQETTAEKEDEHGAES